MSVQARKSQHEPNTSVQVHVQSPHTMWDVLTEQYQFANRRSRMSPPAPPPPRPHSDTPKFTQRACRCKLASRNTSPTPRSKRMYSPHTPCGIFSPTNTSLRIADRACRLQHPHRPGLTQRPPSSPRAHVGASSRVATRAQHCMHSPHTPCGTSVYTYSSWLRSACAHRFQQTTRRRSTLVESLSVKRKLQTLPKYTTIPTRPAKHKNRTQTSRGTPYNCSSRRPIASDTPPQTQVL